MFVRSGIIVFCFPFLSLLLNLHSKSIESSVNNGYCSCYEVRCIADEVLYGSAQFFRTSHATVRSLTNYRFSAGSIATIGVSQQVSVLFGQEEARSNSVYAYSFAEFYCNLSSHKLRKV